MDGRVKVDGLGSDPTVIDDSLQGKMNVGGLPKKESGTQW